MPMKETDATYFTKFRGDYGEAIAAKHLKKKGFRILAQNLRIARYEIDILAEDREYLVFAEVKARTVPHLLPDGSSPFSITPAMAVTKTKQRNLVSAARMYRTSHENDKMIRFDVIEVYLKETTRWGRPAFDVLKVHHIENAFDATSSASH